MLEAIAIGTYSPLSESVVSLEALIFERQDKICVPATKLNANVNATKIESKVVGGNAALVEASIGTLWEVKANGRILFLEDIDEAPYSIERSLDHMKQSGIFDGVDAVIFGDFTLTDTVTMSLVFDRFAASVSYPVFRVTGMGHGEINYALPFLTHSEISSDDGGVSYEFCVDNIQSTSKGNRVHATSNFNLIVGIIIGICLSLHQIYKK